ncbi:hypothetical protein IWQ62_000640 [Dispira parvispora]|uniref:Fungal-type protein kinase domain-containing protein n=1 Tax=Dispira parvispora TaxID=1520584 RepID=A0A9W8E905_9FUNG|nr:hypothetical protein IWQ62_000640 [Dispira parvispora]
MSEKLKTTSSMFRTGNNDSASYQGKSTKDTDHIRKEEIDRIIERKLQDDVSNLVSKVVGFEELGEYEKVASKVEELIILSTKCASARDDEGLGQKKRMLYNNAYKWLNWDQEVGRPLTEHAMYLCIADYLLLVGTVLAENEHEAQGTAIQRRIMPHPERDVRGDPVSNIRHNILLRSCGLDVGVEQEYESFDTDPNVSGKVYIPNKKQKVDQPKPAEREDLDKFPDMIKETFGIIEVKQSPMEDGILKTYARLGLSVQCALDAQFDRHSMWGITVRGPFVRFVLFTHSAVIPSERIDMRTPKGRKQFVDDYVRLSLCPKYRVGYDPTKKWLPRYGRWEVECFNTNQDKNKQSAEGPYATVYVDPKPITPGGHLFGRRTRCHLASLTKTGEFDYVLKESWTEVDGNLNKVEMPNEVRIFNHIKEKDRQLEEPLTENGIPKMVYGGTVCVKTEYVHGNTGHPGQWCYNIMSRYCGELKANTGSGSSHSPSTSQGESTNSGNTDSVIKSVERVHQRLLLTPTGKSMTTLHPYGTRSSSEVPVDLTPDEASELCDDVEYFFRELFEIIYRLHENYGIYHRDLSEGNVLVVETEVSDPTKPDETEIAQVPLLIDFDHARIEGDDVTNQMMSRVGTLPFMSILNLAGRTDKLTFLDECESFLYLFLWKCTIGFTRYQISPPDLRKKAQSVQGGAPHLTFEEKEVYRWASNGPLYSIEKAKRLHMSSKENFSVVLSELRPEFKDLKRLFHDLRDALFTWEGGSGAIVTKVKKTTAKATTGSSNQGTGDADPQGLASDLETKATVGSQAPFSQRLNMRRRRRAKRKSAATPTVENDDPLLRRFDHWDEVAEKFYTVIIPE